MLFITSVRGTACPTVSYSILSSNSHVTNSNRIVPFMIFLLCTDHGHVCNSSRSWCKECGKKRAHYIMAWRSFVCLKISKLLVSGAIDSKLQFHLCGIQIWTLSVRRYSSLCSSFSQANIFQLLVWVQESRDAKCKVHYRLGYWQGTTT
jgi:hypothetical protein